MKIGIFVASERKRGNSEILARFISKNANNVEIDIFYLRDYELKECNGCMRCVFRKERCKLEDDFYDLIYRIIENDALLIISPTYVLTIPGKLKVLLDRMLAVYEIIKDRSVKPAISIGVASPIDYSQFQLPFLNLFLLAMGFKVIDSFLIYGAGPGEVLLDENLEKVKKSISKILNFEDKPYESQVSKFCPVDFNQNFEHIEGNKFRCPICLVPATLNKEGYFFDAKDLNNHRWTKENLIKHFEEWIIPTLPRFKKLLPDIQKKRKEFDL